MMITGAGGGHTVDLRRFASEGVVLLGSVRAFADGGAWFNNDLEKNIQDGDATFAEFRNLFEQHAQASGMDFPEDEDIESAKSSSVPLTNERTLDLVARGITTVLWCTGYKVDFSWLHLPLLDGYGVPIQKRGVTNCPNAYFLGLHWMHKFKSGVLWGVGEDAEYLAQYMQASKS